MARLPSTTLHIHPSSALNYIDESPRWVVYEQVLTTSRPFLLNATYVDESWVIERLADGRLNFCDEDLAAQLLIPQQITGVGKSCIQKLKANRGQVLLNLSRRNMIDQVITLMNANDVRQVTKEIETKKRKTLLSYR